MFVQTNCSEHEYNLCFLPIATLSFVARRLQFGTTV